MTTWPACNSCNSHCFQFIQHVACTPGIRSNYHLLHHYHHQTSLWRVYIANISSISYLNKNTTDFQSHSLESHPPTQHIRKLTCLELFMRPYSSQFHIHDYILVIHVLYQTYIIHVLDINRHHHCFILPWI